MGELTAYFKMIVEKQEDINYPFPKLLNAPVDMLQIIEAEKQLGFKLNEDLIELYSFADGTKLDNETPLGRTGLIPMYNFMSLTDATAYYHVQKYQLGFGELFTTWNTNYTPGDKLFPFLNDSSGDIYWVDLNAEAESYRKIYWTNTLPCSPGYEFNSLTSMFKTISEAYKNNIFFLDEDGYLEQDDDLWSKIVKENNPGLNF